MEGVRTDSPGTMITAMRHLDTVLEHVVALLIPLIGGDVVAITAADFDLPGKTG